MDGIRRIGWSTANRVIVMRKAIVLGLPRNILHAKGLSFSDIGHICGSARAGWTNIACFDGEHEIERIQLSDGENRIKNKPRRICTASPYRIVQSRLADASGNNHNRNHGVDNDGDFGCFLSGR